MPVQRTSRNFGEYAEEAVIIEEPIIKQKRPLFIEANTIEDVYKRQAHTDTTMIDDVYLHETVNDKGTRLINSLEKIKGSTLFKIEEARCV